MLIFKSHAKGLRRQILTNLEASQHFHGIWVSLVEAFASKNDELSNKGHSNNILQVPIDVICSILNFEKWQYWHIVVAD